MTFNTSASSLMRHGHAREVDVAEGLELLHQAQERGLVQFGENVREGVNFICNCCGCCCEAMIAARRFAAAHPIHTTPFLPVVDEAACTGCERCVRRCPVEALVGGLGQRPEAAEADGGPARRGALPGLRRLRPGLPRGRARGSRSAAARALTPLNSAHRAVLMALERGQAPGPGLRQPAALEPPGAGRLPRGRPRSCPRRSGCWPPSRSARDTWRRWCGGWGDRPRDHALRRRQEFLEAGGGPEGVEVPVVLEPPPVPAPRPDRLVERVQGALGLAPVHVGAGHVVEGREVVRESSSARRR